MKEHNEYKNIKIQNNSLTESEFLEVYDKVRKIDKCTIQDNVISFYGKSTSKQVFSPDSGRMTSEYNAFMLSIRFRLGTLINGILMS